MLVICNGAFKSGSSWLFNIIRVAIEYDNLPEQYLRENWNNPSILEDRLPDFLDTIDYQSTNYVSKSHYRSLETKNLIFDKDHVKILNIKRNEKDQLVSAYFHHKNFKNYSGDFKEFYYTKGVNQIKSVRRYHKIWNDSIPNMYITEYEKLKKDFSEEVGRILAFLGVDSTIDLEQLEEKTSFKARKQKNSKSKFLRKGIVGDSANFFTEEMNEHFEKTLLLLNNAK